MHKKVLVFGSAAWIVGLLVSFFFYGAGAKEDLLKRVPLHLRFPTFTPLVR